MKPVFWPSIALAAVITLGCGNLGDDKAPTARPGPTAHVARFTQAEVRNILREADASCGTLPIRYDSRGIWYCDRWSFDEVTGAIFRTPE